MLRIFIADTAGWAVAEAGYGTAGAGQLPYSHKAASPRNRINRQFTLFSLNEAEDRSGLVERPGDSGPNAARHNRHGPEPGAAAAG